jgi:hypothetical protein
MTPMPGRETSFAKSYGEDAEGPDGGRERTLELMASGPM